MILDRHPGEPLGATLDRAVDAGKLTAHDAGIVEEFGDFLRYAGSPGPGSTRAQLRWLAAYVRLERGRVMVFGPDATRDEAEAYAVKLTRAAAWRA